MEDQALRGSAIPYYANIWGYNRSTESDRAIVNTVVPSSIQGGQPSYGDLNPFYTGGPSTVNPVRVLTPTWGDIVEANLNLQFTLATADSAKQFRIAIGTFGSNYAPVTSYTDAYINNQHLKITGRSTPYTIAAAGTFTQNRLNLAPALYSRGDASFLVDGFVVLLVFDAAPSIGAGFVFSKFEVDCTVQMGLL